MWPSHQVRRVHAVVVSFKTRLVGSRGATAQQAVGGGTLPELHRLVRQLWGPLLHSDDYRVMINAVPDPGWLVQQRFRVVTSAQSPRLLVSAGPHRAVARALLAYRGIRGTVPSLGRSILAAATTVRLPLTRNELTLERRIESRVVNREPVSVLASLLNTEIVSIIGMRRGANAKATLQMFTTDGDAVGYGKIAWNKITSEFVLREIETLEDIQGRLGSVRVPMVLAHDTLGSFPFLITSPLPARVQSVQNQLSITELADLAPVQRLDLIRHSRQFLALEERVNRSSDEGVLANLAGPARRLTQVLRSSDLELPLSTRWHGDLVPWNAARDLDGTLWVWDWEMSEPDAAAGLDALHWRINGQQDNSPSQLASRLLAVLGPAASDLRALGLGGKQVDLVAALYALTVAERSMQYATEHGSWHHSRLQPLVVADLLNVGLTLAVQGLERPLS